MDDRNYLYDTNYINEANFTRLKKGSNLPLLETEINDIQVIQEKARTSLVRRLMPSGFIELTQKEFNGEPIAYNPMGSNSAIKQNHIAIAPSRVMINGYELNIEGNFTYNGIDNYTLIDLGDAPLTGNREDLVYLEVWPQIIVGNDQIKKWGYQDGTNLNYSIVDPRVNGETSRRVMFYWNIRVAKDINFNKFPDGIGFNNSGDFSNIRAIVNGTAYNPNNQFTYIFANAASDLFKSCEFYQDHNLYVAGRSDYQLTSPTIYGSYVFALPLFKVKRRNQENYSVNNPNGSIKSNDIVSINSSLRSDLNSNIRPDRLYYNLVNEKDLIDLRRTINTKELYNDYHLDKSLKGLFNGELQTNNTISMRRAQFGNINPDYNDSYIILTSKFNETIIPEQSVLYTSDNNNFVYRNSVGGYGLYLNGNNAITYGLENLTMSEGTIDFFMQPDWYGTDEINQTIFTVKDQLDRIVFELSKEGSNLTLKYFYDANMYNIATVNLNSTLILAKNIYHIRVAWNNAPQINAVFIYVNGKLSGQQNFSDSVLIPSQITIGAVEVEVKGFVIEDLIVYNHSFEYNNITQSGAYITNDYWDNLAKDVLYGEAIIYPSFNGKMKNFSDNNNIQDNTVEHVSDLNGALTFDITAPIGIIIYNSIPVVYDMNGDIIVGTWTNLNTRIATFTSATSMTEVIVQYSLEIPGGNGGQDVPIEILAAGLIDNDITEVSYNKMDSQPRSINFLQPRMINGSIDHAYDYSINREQNECFARLLYYYENGNGTNEYTIPDTLYGYEVLGIMQITNQKILNITKDTLNNSFFIELKESVLFGETLEFKLALGGMSFDYDIYSKNLVHDIHKTVMLEFVANGTDYEYIIPCTSNINGGVLKSVFKFSDNIFDNNGNYIQSTDYNVAYVNGTIYNKIVLNNQSNYILNSFVIQNDSFETPFLRIRFDHKPKSGDIVQIPVFVSYQPSETEVLSLWYNHIPYQGTLNGTPQKFKRLSSWKYFITTYGSGNSEFIDDTSIYSFNNVINRLPGGSSYAYDIDGNKIILEYLSNTINNPEVNGKLTFISDVFYNNSSLSKDLFFNLDTDLIISKTASGYQDGKVIIQDKEFDIFMPNTQNSINKYLGMSSLVMNEIGEIMLLVIGCLDTELSTTNKLVPLYGDVFRIKDIPTTIANF